MGNLEIGIITIIRHIPDARFRVYKGASFQAVIIVVFVSEQTLAAVFLQHGRFYKIAIAIILTLNEFFIGQHPRFIKMQDITLHHGILSNHLLHKTLHTHIRSIFIIRCHVHIEITDGMAALVVERGRLADIAIIGHRVERTIAFGLKIAPLAL